MLSLCTSYNIVFFAEGVGPYNAVNQQMLKEYCKQHTPDGEIVFLAANPNSKVKGVGTFLLNELEQREAGKTLYLYTDTGCNYQFYERKGFKKMASEALTVKVGEKSVEMCCLLYSKKFDILK